MKQGNIVELFSPIPPMKTGTATYLGEVLKAMRPILAFRQNVRIAIDPTTLAPDDDVPADLYGFPVVDYRRLAKVPDYRTTRVYFSANNAYHAYIHRLLSAEGTLAGGRVITVVHDPALFMLSRQMFGDATDSFDRDDLVGLMESQLGERSGRYFSSRLREELPRNVEYTVHCLGGIMANSHEVWVHSLFAAAKLILENDMTADQLPRIRLCAHPVPRVRRPAAGEAPPDAFVIGMFGWVTEPKRVDAVLRGLALALDRLPPEAGDTVRLLVVGRKPPEWHYEPRAVAASLRLDHVTDFIDYPDTATFEALQQLCSMIFNLRYPSTGETSGTLATASVTDAAIVTSRYQSFYEVGAPGATVTALPILEEWEIARQIEDGYRRWAAGQPPDRPESGGYTGAPVEKLMMCEILERVAPAFA